MEKQKPIQVAMYMRVGSASQLTHGKDASAMSDSDRKKMEAAIKEVLDTKAKPWRR